MDAAMARIVRRTVVRHTDMAISLTLVAPPRGAPTLFRSSGDHKPFVASTKATGGMHDRFGDVILAMQRSSKAAFK
jgi:hypothetical protein